MTSTTATQSDAKKSNGTTPDVVKTVEQTVEKLQQNVERGAGRLQRATTRLTDGVMTSVRENPKAAAGVVLGVGVLLGAVAHRLLFPRRSVTELFSRALRDGAAATTHTLMMGVRSAGRMVG